ncbi:MAG: gliding motility lipoprotein GldD [Bacteroidetes bacterium]|nr:gliding motility lipoprotein GldD [Bacteroidota bacterium]
MTRSVSIFRIIQPFSFGTWLGLLCLFGFTSCDDEEYYAPKPKGYYRMSFPEKSYVTFNENCPFQFEYPVYSKIVHDKRHSNPCWINVEFYKYNATLHLSYKQVDDTTLEKAVQDSWELASKHQIKADGIEEELIQNDSTRVYGLVYHIEGNAASSVQFFLTDSVKHFIRGSFYFNCKPNKDSLAPALSFIEKDIDRFVKNFRWK